MRKTKKPAGVGLIKKESSQFWLAGQQVEEIVHVEPRMTLIMFASRNRKLSLIADRVSSYVHMHVNRLLRSAHRAQELVLYDFLARFYESQAARTRGELN